MLQHDLKPGDALLIVDVQVDFCPGGALPVPEGDEVVPILNEWISAARRTKIPVVASRDWHPRQHLSFEDEGGERPPHCVQYSTGAAFHPGLELPDDVLKVSKGLRFDKDQYSAFDDTGLGRFLRRQGVRRIWLGGLAEDVCVRALALAAREEGFEIRLIADATRAIDDANGEKAERAMREAGAVIEKAA
jgi:nicotinamidase/pyrazinamidase